MNYQLHDTVLAKYTTPPRTTDTDTALSLALQNLQENHHLLISQGLHLLAQTHTDKQKTKLRTKYANEQ